MDFRFSHIFLLFMQQAIFHVRIEMRRSLMFLYNNNELH